MSPSNNVGKPEPGVAPQDGKRPFKSLGKKPAGKPVADTSAPPLWAVGLMSQIEGLNSRIGLIESKGFMPKPSFSQAAASSAATSPGGGVPILSVEPSQPAQAPTRGAPAKPPKGQSGSGYTRIPNGKLVRNKRPATKSLPARQAKNWRSRATTDLVAFLKERGIGSDDPKPVGDANYRALVLDLEYSKAYFAYVKGEDEPVEVQDWKSSHPPPTRPRSASPRGSAAGQLAKVSSDT